MRRLFCILVVLLSFFVVGCGSSKEMEVLAEELQEPYTISTGSIHKGNIYIEYPIIEGYYDEGFQKKWNERIYSEIENRIVNLGDEDTCNMKYSISLKSEKMLSILMEGYEYYQGATYPHKFNYTYNISFENDDNIRLEDKYDTLQIARYLLSGVNYTVNGVSKEEFTGYLKSAYANEQELQEILNQFDFNYKEKMEVYGYSIYTKENLVLYVEVPNVLGDYVSVSIPYENLTEILEEY